jgi:hypothetical protein
VFGSEVHYGQVVKNFEAQAEQDREEGQPLETVVSQQKQTIIGFPPRFQINTSFVERSNLTMRMNSRRFTRKTNGFSKRFLNHCAAVNLQVAYYNFCRVHETIRSTPAAHLGLTERPWSVAELIEAANFARARVS